jgi:uncharacterized membrane protein (UPF0127 family)
VATRSLAGGRFGGLPTTVIFGFEFPVATDFRARLLGLARLDREEAGVGLLIPRCNSVHTFGMRFELDLVFLDQAQCALTIRRAVPPRRFASHRAATAVLELPSGGNLPRLFPAKSGCEGGEIVSRPP